MDAIRVNSDTNFWYYIIEKKSWTTLEDHFQSDSDEIFIPSFKNNPIQKGDVVCIYIAKEGFVCAVQVDKQPLSSKKRIISIFRDSSVGQYNVAINKIGFTHGLIPATDVYRHLQDVTSCKSSRSYIMRFLRGDFVFISVEKDMGKTTLDALIELSDIRHDEELVEKVLEMKEQEALLASRIPANDNPIKIVRLCNTNSFNVKGDGSMDSSILDVELDMEISSNSTNSNSSDFDDAFISIEDSDQEAENKVSSMVPIIFIPCKNYRKLNECNNDVDYEYEFKKHYTKCHICEINNNGTKDLTSFLNKSDIICEKADMEDTGFEELLNSYYSHKEYIIPGGYETKNTITLHHIDDGIHDYDGCILIEWCIKKSVFTKAKLKGSKSSSSLKSSKIPPKKSKKVVKVRKKIPKTGHKDITKIKKLKKRIS